MIWACTEFTQNRQTCQIWCLSPFLFWEVHHRFQQNDAIAKWVYNHGRIKVHDLDNLRAVPHFIHSKITKKQDDFWRKYTVEHKAKNIQDLLENKLTKSQSAALFRDYQKFVRELDREYAPYWLDSRARPATLGHMLDNLNVKSTRGLFGVTGQRNFELGEPFRDARLTTRTGINFGVFFMAIGSADQFLRLQQSVTPGTPEADALLHFQAVYRNALISANGDPANLTKGQARPVQESWLTFLRAINADARLLYASEKAFTFYIDRLPGAG